MIQLSGDLTMVIKLPKAIQLVALKILMGDLIRAVAFLVEPAVSEVMSQFYIRTSHPPIPTKSFRKKEEALKFLRPFVEGKDDL